MKTKPALLFLALAFLAAPLLPSAALADGGRGWDRGWCGADRGHVHHHHRHHSHRHDRDLVRHWGRGDRGPILVYRDGRRYERPWVERRTVVYRDRWR